MIITEEIQKQANAGFTSAEIKSNLSNLGFTEAEIEKNKQTILHAKPTPDADRPTVWKLLLGILAVVRGFIYISKGIVIPGVLLMCGGIVSISLFVSNR